MSILPKLAWRQMKLNRRRTLVTIVGAVISVAMITAVASFAGSFVDLFRRVTISQSGEYHVAFTGVGAKTVAKITGDPNTAGHYTVQDLGLAQPPGQIAPKRFFHLRAINAGGFAPAQTTVTQGRLPQNDSEILLSEALLEDGNAGFAVGDILSLDMGRRIDKDAQVIEPPLPYSASYETFEKEETKRYTVVGFAKSTVFDQSYVPSYPAYTLLDENALPEGATYSVYTTVKDTSVKLYDNAQALHDAIGEGKVKVNNELLLYMGVNDDSRFLGTLYMIVGVLTAIIVIGSVALIYNAFAISVAERRVHFGMMASIGATGRQKRRLVLVEAGLIALISIPVGILAGLGGLGLTFALISPMFTSVFDVSAPLRLAVEPSAIMVAVGVSALTIFLSAWIPALRAARIPPMEAIRQTKDIRLRPRSLKTSRLSRKLFGFEAALAMKNLKRNRKRYRTTIFSLVVSLTIFLSACGFTYYLQQAYGRGSSEVPADVTVNVDSGMDARQNNQEVVDQIAQFEGISRFTSFYTGVLYADLPKSTLGKLVAHNGFTSPQDSGKSALDIYLYAPDAAVLKSFAEETGVDYASMLDADKPRAIVVNDYTFKDDMNNSTIDFSVLLAKPGDTLTGKRIVNEQSVENPDEYIRKEISQTTFEIAALTDKRFPGIPKIVDSIGSVFVVISQQVFNQLHQMEADVVSTQILLDCSDREAVIRSLDKLFAQMPAEMQVGGHYSDLSSARENNEQMLLIINIFVFGFVTLISAVGVANIFNTVSTSLMLRKREFAMLKSVGMSPRAFRRMIRYESLLYGSKAVLYGLPVSFVVLCLLYGILGRNFEMAFSLPWIAVVAGVGAIFVIVAMTMAYASRKLKRQNIVDGLRSDNL